MRKEENWTPDQEPSETEIWRFIDIYKLIDLIKKEKLRFSSIDELNDPYEGRFTKERFESEIEKTINKTGHRPSKARREDASLAKYLTDNDWAVSCWCRHESKHLWEIYSNGKFGISIKSTVGNVVESLKLEDRELYHGKVEYGKEPSVMSGQKLYIFHKNRMYKGEDEYRFALHDDMSKSVPCDLKTLIDKIHIYPEIKKWEINRLKELMPKDLRTLVTRSPINENPYE